jgi:hypothetical protein
MQRDMHGGHHWLYPVAQRITERRVMLEGHFELEYL